MSLSENDKRRGGDAPPFLSGGWRALPPVAFLAIALLLIVLLLAVAVGPIAAGQATMNGLVSAGYFALGAVGLTLVYGVLRLVNFAHGDMLTFGTYVTLGVTSLGVPFWPAAALAMIVTALLAVLLDKVIWEPMRRARTSTLQLFLVAIGLALVLRYSVQFFGGGQVRSVGLDTTSSVDIGPWHLGNLQFIVMLVGLATILLTGAGLRYTRLGKEMRAVADNIALAEVAGIDTRRTIRITWAVAGGLAALAGILYATAIGSINPNFGFTILLSLFAAAVSGRHRQCLWRAGRGRRHRPRPGMVDPVLQPALEARHRFRHPDPDLAADAARNLRPQEGALMSVDFWLGVGVIAGIYGIFVLGLQINVGFTGLLNLGQAGFMGIGAYAMGMLVTDAGWSLWWAMPVAVMVAVLAGVLVGLPSLRLRSDYFAIATIAFAEIVRYTFQNADFAGGNQGIIGFDQEWRDLSDWLLDRFAGIGLGDETQLPLFLAVWITFLLCLIGLRFLQRSPWGRVLRAIREDEDAASALGKNVFAYKLQSLGIAAALAAIAGFFLSFNVTYLYPSEFDPTFTFFGYAVLILGGFASYGGVALGAVLLWSVMEGLRFLHLPLSTGQIGSLRFVLIGLILILASMLRPQGLLGRKAEMQLRQ